MKTGRAGRFTAYSVFCDSFYRASTYAGKACDADVLIAFGLSFFIELKSSYGACTNTCAAADAQILINCYGHFNSSLLRIIAFISVLFNEPFTA